MEFHLYRFLLSVFVFFLLMTEMWNFFNKYLETFRVTVLVCSLSQIVVTFAYFVFIAFAFLFSLYVT